MTTFENVCAELMMRLRNSKCGAEVHFQCQGSLDGPETKLRRLCQGSSLIAGKYYESRGV